MKIDWNIIDTFLLGELDTDDLSFQCKEEVTNFLQTHDFDTLSDESLEQLSGIWDLVYKAQYENMTNTKIPNIFKVIQQPEEEQEQKEVIDERETLSSGF